MQLVYFKGLKYVEETIINDFLKILTGLNTCIRCIPLVHQKFRLINDELSLNWRIYLIFHSRLYNYLFIRVQHFLYTKCAKFTKYMRKNKAFKLRFENQFNMLEVY